MCEALCTFYMLYSTNNKFHMKNIVINEHTTYNTIFSESKTLHLSFIYLDCYIFMQVKLNICISNKLYKFRCEFMVS
jgi:hypothetical protein